MREEGKRLKNIRKSLALTQTTFAEGLGLKQGPYSMIESGKVGLSSDVLKKLISTYRINPVWLFEGQGPMTMEVDAEVEVPDLTRNMPPLPQAEALKNLGDISLARLTQIRNYYPAASTDVKDEFIEELIGACMALKEENSQQKGQIIKLMEKLQNLLVNFR